MSRYEVIHKDKGLAFGTDHACGEFLQIWKRPTDPKERRKQDMYGPNPDEMLVDEDSMFNRNFKSVRLQLIAEHGFTLKELTSAAIMPRMPDLEQHNEH